MLIIGLMWHDFPSENLGVGALTHAHISLLDDIFDRLKIEVEYLVIGNVDCRDVDFAKITRRPMRYIRLSIKNLIISPVSYFSIKTAVASCNLVIDLSAGDSFTDIYGFKRFIQQCITKYIAINTKIPLILCPQTIGPFNKWYSKIVSRYIVGKSKHIFSRDNLSHEYLNMHTKRENTELASDLAFLLPYNSAQFQFDTSFINIGVNVSGLLFNGGYNNNNQFSMKMDYPIFIRQLIRRFLTFSNVRVHLVPHVISKAYEVDDDYRACQLLSKEFTECVLAPCFATPSEAKSYISSLSFFTGARMHSTIAAFSSGVPVVPVSYSRKFEGLFSSLGYNYVVDGQKTNNDDAVEFVISAFLNSCEISRTISLGNNTAKQRLEFYIDYMLGLVKELNNG